LFLSSPKRRRFGGELFFFFFAAAGPGGGGRKWELLCFGLENGPMASFFFFLSLFFYKYG